MIQYKTDYRLEDYILNTRWSDLPEEVKNRAVDCGIDLMTALIVGSKGEQFRNGIRLSHYLKDGEIEIPGSRERFSFLGAAFALGHASNSFDIDDGHNLIKGHPGTSFVAGIMAAGLEQDVTYREYLTTLVVAYDVAVRIGQAVQDYYHFLHSTGTYGAVGTAAGVGRIFGFTRKKMNTAISMAEFHAPMTPVMRSVQYPSMNKDGVPFGAMIGALAALDTMAGETAKVHILEFDQYRKFLDTLGKDYEIMNLYFKPYTCCRWAHQPIQASIDLMREHNLKWYDIEKVTVHTFDAATQLSKIVPSETDEAQYNIAFPVASAIVCGDVGFAQVNNKALKNPDVLKMMDRLEFVLDPDMEAQFPAKRLAWVEFKMANGEILKTRPYAADGEATDHVDRKWMTDKFNRILAPILSEKGRRAVFKVLTGPTDQKLRNVVADVNAAIENYGVGEYSQLV